MLSIECRPKRFSEVIGQDLAVKTLKEIARAPGVAARSIVLQGSFGCGKCVPGDTRVFLHGSYLPIKDLLDRSGTLPLFFSPHYDVSFSREGTVLVIAAFKQKDMKVLNLKLSNGFVVRGTPDHRVLASKNGVVKLRKLSSLNRDSQVLFPGTPIQFSASYLTLPEIRMAAIVQTSYVRSQYKLVGSLQELRSLKEEFDLKNSVRTTSKSAVGTLWLTSEDKKKLQVSRFFNKRRISDDVFSSSIYQRLSYLTQVLALNGCKSGSDFNLKLRTTSDYAADLVHLILTLGLKVRSSINNNWAYFTISDPDKVLSVGYSQSFQDNFTHKLTLFSRLFGESVSHYHDWRSYSVKEVSETCETVYDVTVRESSHEFYCQGTFNHNTTSARIFAKAVNCTEFKKTGDVCLACDPCKDVDMPNSSHYLEFDASRVGNVDSIKSLVDRLSYMPADGRRVVCLDECHASSHAALTALLKVLEDGVPNTFFIFSTTEPLMKTIMSRSCVIPISTVNSSLLEDYVKKIASEHNIEISQEDVQQLVLKSGGHVRNAMQLLDHYRIAGYEAIKTSYSLISKFVLACIRKEDTTQLLKDLEKFALVDIKNSLYQFIKNCLSGNGAFEKKLKEKNLASKLFLIWFQPEVQEALKDEFGVIIAFKFFQEKFL